MVEVLEHHGILRLQPLKYVLMFYTCDVHGTEGKKKRTEYQSKSITDYQVKQV